MIKIIPVSHKKIEDTDIGKGKLYNNGKDKLDTEQTEVEVYDFQRGSSVELDNSIENGNTKVAKEDIIKSRIDGEIDYTNTQDTNTNDLNGYWKTLAGSATAQLGISNSFINDIAGTVNDINELINPEAAKLSLEKTDLNSSMSKLKQWKANKYKDLHPFDWKPGQTVPQDLMNTSIGSLMNNFGAGNATYDNIKSSASVDPILYSRNAMKASKGLFGEKTFKVQSKENRVSYTSGFLPKWKEEEETFGGYHKSDEETKYINALKNKNTFNKTLGYLYIKPNYNYGFKIEDSQIPFEFNPDISESGPQATYVSETLLNRIGQYQVYTGTNLSQVNINLKYIALSPDDLGEEDNNNLSKQFSTDAWQYYWTNNRIEKIEYQLRSLVFPDVTSAEYLVKPPMIEIHIGNDDGVGVETVGDLYKYPMNLGDKYLSVSRSVGDGNVNRFKKYIVTNVQIDKVDDDSFIWPSLYGRVWQGGNGSPINHIKTGKELYESGQNGFSGYSRRTGFKATLQCIEVTENFLDIVPDFKAYYNAWNAKGNLADESYKYSKIFLGIDEKDLYTEDSLTAAIQSTGDILNEKKESLNSKFEDSRSYARIYKDMNTEGKSLCLYDKAFSQNAKNKYYFINFEKEKSDTVLFNVKLDNIFSKDGEFNNQGVKIYESTIPQKELYDEKMKPTGLNAVSKKVSKEDIYGNNDEEDIFGLFDKEEEGEAKEGKLNFIGNSTGTFGIYTDVQCYYLMLRMEEIKKEISNHEVPDVNSEENKYSLFDIFEKFINNSTDEFIENDYLNDYLKENSMYNDILKKHKDLNKILFDTNALDNCMLRDLSTLSVLDGDSKNNYISQITNSLDGWHDPILSAHLKDNKLKTLITNEFKEKIGFSSGIGGKNIRTEFFSGIKTQLEVLGTDKSIVAKLTKNIEKIYETCLNNMINGFKICEDIVNGYYSKDKCLKDVKDSLIEAIEIGSNIKCVKEKQKTERLLFKSAYVDFGSNSSNLPSYDQKSAEETVIYYKTYTNNNVKILSILDINNAMTESLNQSVDALKDLHNNIVKCSSEKFELAKASNFEDRFLEMKKIYQENILDTNKENIKKLKVNIYEGEKCLRKSLNKESVSYSFHKIAGLPESDNSKKGIKKLKELKNEYDKYSKKDGLREVVYSEWDALGATGFSAYNNLVVSGNFKKDFENSENGTIPNDYYKIISQNGTLEAMSVAGKGYNTAGITKLA